MKNCPENKILNPKSNHCITKGTQLHKLLIKEGILSADTLDKSIKKNVSKPVSYQSAQDDFCPKGKVLNPKSNHCISIGSVTYNKLVKDGVLSGEEEIKLKKDYALEVEFVKDNKEQPKDNKEQPKDNKEQPPKVLKLSPSAKKLFLGKVKSFLKKKNKNILEINKDVYDNECLYKKSILPTTTIVMNKITMKYYSRNYFPTVIRNKPINFFHPNININNNVIASDISININNLTKRYFENVLKLPLSDVMDKQLLDYEWLNDCNTYIKNLSIIDKFTLYAYSFHGDRYVNNFLRGTLNGLQVKQSMNRYISLEVYNPLFFEYIHSRGKYEEFIKTHTSLQYKKYLDHCKSMELLSSTNIVSLVKRYNDRLSSIISKAPVLKQRMTLFRGTKDLYFNKKQPNKPFIHNGYMSASIDYNVSLNPSFSTNDIQGNQCCLMVINVLPGTRMIPMTGLSQVNSEKEFLFNTNSKIMVSEQSRKVEKIPSGDICMIKNTKTLNVTHVFIG